MWEHKAIFVYGDAPEGSEIAKESVREAVDRIRIGKDPLRGVGFARARSDSDRETGTLGGTKSLTSRSGGGGRPACEKFIRNSELSAGTAPA